MQRMHTFFFTATPYRMLIESVALYILLALLVFIILNLSPDSQFICLHTIDTNCLLLASLRLRFTKGRWECQLGYESKPALVLSSTLALLYSIIVLSGQSSWIAYIESVEADSNMLMDVGWYLFGNFTIYGLLRASIGMWRWVYQLHRKQLRWLMTYAMGLSIAVAGVLLVSMVAIILLILISTESPLDFGDGNRFVSWIIDVLTLIWELTPPFAAGLILIFPFAAFLAFYLSRHTTRRITQLSSTASVMQAGDLSARVLVEGEDEVAQLQIAFNAMAADLQRTMDDLAQANTALQAERDAITQLLLERRVLIANVSHELRTPIATLRGYLESALTHWNGAPPPTLRSDLKVMQRETIRMQRLIDDLFTLSRAEVGELSLNLAPTDLQVTLRRSLKAAAPSVWKWGKIELIDAIPTNLPSALVDEGRLEQILRNLLRNAIRHTPPGGMVVISAEVEPAAVIVHVKDTGEGIAPEDLPYIFDRFYRAPSMRERDGSGAGIGLTLVKELAEAMGGSVIATSTPGNGACMSVRLRRE